MTVQAGKKKTIKIKNKLKSCKYTFKSNKKKVAVVSSTGVVKGVKAGSANITVREASKKGKGKVRKLGVVKVKVTPKKNNKVTTPPSPTDDGTKVTPQPSTQDPIPTDGNKPGTAGAAVKVYMDEIKDENLIAEAEGVGFTPSPEPEPEKPGEATPEPTPAVIFDVNAEDGESGVIQKRGNATLTIVDGGANSSKKQLRYRHAVQTGMEPRLIFQNRWRRETSMRFPFMQSRRPVRTARLTLVYSIHRKMVMELNMMESVNLTSQMIHGQNVRQP